MSWHFDYRAELDNIARGIDRDMQQPVGQTLPWYIYDSASTVVDSIYDVGAVPTGRKWFAPQYLEVANAIKLEGTEVANDRGFYVLDTITLVFSADAARKSGLQDLINRPDEHNLDRVVYENKVFAINQVRVRGVLSAGYAVCAAEGVQVKFEELVNDPQFQSYIPLDDG